MRDLIERFVLLPFSLGCDSQTSVALGSDQLKQQKIESTTRKRRGEESLSGVRLKKNSVSFLAHPKPNISSGIQRLIRSFKSFSQLFVYKEKGKMEKDMVIGFPTDVKHVTHIGWDGSTATNLVKGWEDFEAPEILANFPSISLRQFELAMAAQADSDTPLVVDSFRQY